MNADEFFSPANRKQPTPKCSPGEVREWEEKAAQGIDRSDEDESDG